MKKISIMIMVLVVALASCKKTPEVNLKYVDVERDLVTVGTTTANIQCDYDYIATLKKAYLFYGEGENEDDFTSAEMRVVQNTLYVELTGLKSITTYNYYYEFHNGFNSMRTTLKSFKTEASPVDVTLPTVITAEVTEITTNSAKGGGEVTHDGGAEVTERGICWSTHANPILEDNHVAVGSGTGAFTAAMSDLESNTTYHVRAYATNEKGTAYGLDREFMTLSGGGGGSGNAPEGAINGLFTINENGDQVYFSQGNLQYQASTNTWRFAEHQWDYVGETNSIASSFYSGWIDLFGWGTSGWNNGNAYYHPWDTIQDKDLYGPVGLYNLTGNYANADWGVYNAISNGGNHVNQWRTLTDDEWDYVFDLRNASMVNGIANARYAKAKVADFQGVILFPDNYTHPSGVAMLTGINETGSIGWNGNNYNVSDFALMEKNGAVFLPSSGRRDGIIVSNVESDGYYWSVSYWPESGWAFGIWFNSVNCSNGFSWRSNGYSVRLVQDVNPQNTAK